METSNLKKIVGIKSLSGKEDKALVFIQKIGLKMKVKSFWQDKNVIFYIKGKDDSKAFIFNGHLDTVSEGDIKEWKSPPFGEQIKIDSNKIYGLGTSDMKGAIFAFLEVAKYFAKHPSPIDLWFSFVTKEEVDGSGTKSFVNWFSKNKLAKYKEVNALIGEPTGMSEIDIGHKGNYFIKITSFGDSGHGAYPKRIKKHAVFEMIKIIKDLGNLEKKWQKKYFHEKLGKASIALATSITAGDAGSPNKFPDSCAATFDIRTTPKVHDLVLKEIKTILKKYDCKIETVFDPAYYSFTKENEKVVINLKKIVGDLPLKVANGASDQCFFSQSGIPTVVFGPGEKKIIHKPNEFCFLDKIEKSIEIYKSLIESMSL